MRCWEAIVGSAAILSGELGHDLDDIGRPVSGKRRIDTISAEDPSEGEC
jgi:hypothetical protein